MPLPLIGITMGDPTGIGPEIIVKALAKGESFQACRPVIFGDEGVLLRTVKSLGIGVSVEVCDRIPKERYAPRIIYLLRSSQLNAGSLQIGKPD
ncbi:MAG TPA: hypothetical protein VLK23_01605, partial [Thermodesulfobacteriota bacterium]|nr:hypothetical protein [Thermodesulfobacteriota bacterium]